MDCFTELAAIPIKAIMPNNSSTSITLTVEVSCADMIDIPLWLFFTILSDFALKNF